MNFLITPQCSLCLEVCSDHCKTCNTAGQCSTCNDGFIVKTDQSGCDVQFICLSNCKCVCVTDKCLSCIKPCSQHSIVDGDYDSPKQISLILTNSHIIRTSELLGPFSIVLCYQKNAVSNIPVHIVVCFSMS